MARCPHCNKVLSDDWLLKNGASLMGSRGGPSKARPTELAQKAAKARWENKKKPRHKT